MKRVSRRWPMLMGLKKMMLVRRLSLLHSSDVAAGVRRQERKKKKRKHGVMAFDSDWGWVQGERTVPELDPPAANVVPHETGTLIVRRLPSACSHVGCTSDTRTACFRVDSNRT
ncbi:hypothetical protein EV363DRAFT_1321290 [Boletus edulis]|uniref:Uncharacterized protein n=1 Tax=Boletus edulis BED1 TaxID=1328754 RepID=A0AAD4BVY8_BOLED|nr:hypothetical protein EV363DRAFT_1321290 [Boletus edulis]KAF8441463.1 hypothetical protein L210DRAFT_3537251 [Boletus edulis BED1]